MVKLQIMLETDARDSREDVIVAMRERIFLTNVSYRFIVLFILKRVFSDAIFAVEFFQKTYKEYRKWIK